MITPRFAGMGLLPVLTALMVLDAILTHIGLSSGGVHELNPGIGILYGWNIWVGDGAKVMLSAVAIGCFLRGFGKKSYTSAWALVFILSAVAGIYVAVVAWNITVLVLRLV